MQVSKRGGTIAAIILAATTATLVAQTSEVGAGSLGELTAEIRRLRFAIEQSTRTQTQAQALGIFLSAQQSRILQVTARLDGARKELEAIAHQSTERANHLAELEAHILKVSDPNEHAAIEDRTRGLKLEMKASSTREQQARAREADVLQAWQQEEARWNDLIARLQQLLER